MSAPTFQPYADSERAMAVTYLLVAEQTPETTLVYFQQGASAVMRTADFNARYTLVKPT